MTTTADTLPFAFPLNAPAVITASGERGVVIAYSRHVNAEDQYLLRYVAADGRATEVWWTVSALQADNGAAA